MAERERVMGGRTPGLKDRNGRDLTRLRKEGVGGGRAKSAACRSGKHNVCAMIVCPCECHKVKDEETDTHSPRITTRRDL